jgi:hypothetical protein
LRNASQPVVRDPRGVFDQLRDQLDETPELDDRLPRPSPHLVVRGSLKT